VLILGGEIKGNGGDWILGVSRHDEETEIYRAVATEVQAEI
jgi:hypothetical protein